MATIILVTFINAPVEKVFDLSRSIDLHQHSMKRTREKAIAGRLSGLIEEGETVTWEAKHIFKIRRLTSKIVSMQRPWYFKDEMLEGDFALMHHEHYFAAKGNGTEMKDVFIYKVPFGIAGKLFDQLFLKNYMKALLKKRNSIIKITLETDAVNPVLTRHNFS